MVIAEAAVPVEVFVDVTFEQPGQRQVILRPRVVWGKGKSHLVARHDLYVTLMLSLNSERVLKLVIALGQNHLSNKKSIKPQN